MATRFLLPCNCGREIPVEPGHAGESVTCECGNRVQVPKLGQLRLLPRVQSVVPERSWSLRHGLIALSAIVAGICLLLGIYSWAVTPTVDAEDLEAARVRVEEYFDALSPADTWKYWHQRIVPMARDGLAVESSPQKLAHDAEVELRQTHQKLAFGGAGLAILVCISLAIWRPARPGS